jgi:antitoxin (DNA-binding transcriptional repressor) of toxin-antitoxin stability system
MPHSTTTSQLYRPVRDVRKNLARYTKAAAAIVVTERGRPRAILQPLLAANDYNRGKARTAAAQVRRDFKATLNAALS